MKNVLLILIVVFLSLNSGAQIISRFTWESNPATVAIAGPNASSISSYAGSATGGKSGTRGLNPGDGRNDINMVLDGGIFNIPAIDIAVDFKREESQASFFNRDSYFDFGMNGNNIAVNFRVTSGTSFTSINSGNIYSVTDDHNFHNYRFNYDNNTGQAKVWVDGGLVYTYTGTVGAPLYWTGAGNVTVGKNMDGNAKNIAILDNFIVQKYANALLPVKLLAFTAEAKNKFAAVKWTSTEEINIASYTVEKSSNGTAYTAIGSVAAANGYSNSNNYLFTDSLAFGPVSYYRLKMTNNDGSFVYSDTKTISFAVSNSTTISVFPNPTADYATIKMNNAVAGKYLYTVSSASGQPVASATVQLCNGAQQMQIDLTKTTVKGILVIQIRNLQTNASTSFSVIKK